MKKTLTMLIFVTASLTAFTQPPQPPNGGEGNHYGWENGKGNPHGAPIGSGTMILISLGIGYGVKKYREKL
jgi:hypothetical protein